MGIIRQALRQHCLIYFRKQRISERSQVDFTRYFGRPVQHVRKQLDRPIKEIFLISNLKKNGQPIGALSNEEIGFHSDLSYLPQPGTISTLYAVELPEGGGGATRWCNGYAAYEALDEGLKERLRGLRAVHRHSVEAQNRPYPVSHPLACTHPETGRKALYLGPPPHQNRCRSRVLPRAGGCWTCFFATSSFPGSSGPTTGGSTTW